MSDFDELDGILGYGQPKGTLGALRKRGEEAGTHAGDLDQILGYGQTAPAAQDPRKILAAQEIRTGKPGPDGLVWGPSGGWDPKTLELVVAGKPFSQPGWGPGQNLAEAASLGLGTRAAAAKAAAQAPGGDFSQRYGEALSQIQGARKAWEEEHGGQALATELAGSAASTLPLLALGGGVAGAALGRVPGGSAAARFLSGNAGAYGQGLGQTGLRVGSDVASGALAGAAGSALQAGLHEGTLAEQAQTGGLAGAVAGPLLNPLARAIIPTDVSISKPIAQAAEKLRGQGVEVTGQQMLKKTPGTTEQLEQYTNAVAKTFGADKVMEQMGVKGITPEVLEQARANIGQKFEDFVAAGGTAVDMPAFQSLQASIQNALVRPGLTQDQVSSLRDVGKYVAQTIATSMGKNGGMLDGTSFRALTATNGPLGHLFSSSDPVLRGYAKEVQSTLYDLAARAAPPDAAKALTQARKQWANLKAVEGAVVDAGTRGGMVDPARVAGVLKRPGLSPELSDLAQGARLLARPTAQGTAQQKSTIGSFLANLPATGIGGMGGYLASIGVTDPSSLSAIASSLAHAPTGTSALIGTLAGMAATGAAKSLGNKYANSPAFTNALIRKALDPRAGAEITVNPLIAAGAPVYNYGERK